MLLMSSAILSQVGHYFGATRKVLMRKVLTRKALEVSDLKRPLSGPDSPLQK